MHLKSIVSLFGVILSVSSCNTNRQSQPIDKNFVTADWTYRSMLNNPIDTIPFNDLEFATAIMHLKNIATDSITGELDMGQSGKLLMSGKITSNASNVLQFQLEGDGIKGTSTEGWIYNYFGYAIPKWKQGKDQVDALVGSVVRTVDHGQAKAGKVASFYMVKR